MRAPWTSASILLLVAAIAGCNKKGGGASAKAPPPTPVQLELATATTAPAPDELVLTGMVAADQRAEVTADTQGKVIAVMVERGQRIKLGAPVVQLDVRTAALSAREAHANVEAARAQRGLAEEECRRAQTLLDKGAITRSEYDRQTTQCTSALQQVSAAEARAAMVAKSVADGIVRAPFDGMVAQRSVTPGEWVAPGRALFTLVDDDPLRVELSVPEAAIRMIRLGQQVGVRAVAEPGRTYAAKVTRIGAEIGRTRALIVEATLDPGADLVPGMFVSGHVTIGQTALPALPAAAVVKRGKQWRVFVVTEPAPDRLHRGFQEVWKGRLGRSYTASVSESELRERIVQLGAPPGPGLVSIANGLRAGERVVARVSDQVVDGTVVILRADAPAATTPPTGRGN